MGKIKKSGMIVCLGSIIMDLSVGCTRFPNLGETLYTSQSYIVSPGGKGSNQAIAAARLGGKVKMLGKVSDDAYGLELQKHLVDAGIDIEFLHHDMTEKSGVAFVWFDEKGQNQIICSPGVHQTTTIADLEEGLNSLKDGDILLMTMEYPQDILLYSAKKAKEQGAFVIVDPSSLGKYELNKDLASVIDIIKPNEIEAELLTGIKITDMNTAQKAMAVIKNAGVTYPLISLGEQGIIFQENADIYRENGIKVTALDTTAAGDTFLGALAVKLSQGKTLKEAVAYGNRAAAICVQRRGAQVSIPFANELDK